MAVQFRWPLLGVIIPSVLKAIVGYGSHWFVFRHHLSQQMQLAFEISMTILWISYATAIFSDPGSPPSGFKPAPGEWRRWCKKCKNYKPERSHHCRTCNKCVLKMDHHCPWTYNCVGHKNMGHFMRYLVWLLITSSFVAIELGKRAVEFYHDRNLPAYLIDETELVAVIVIFPINFFIGFSVFILYIRCVINWVFKGMTQIEVWELERIDSQLHTERIWLQIRKNYFKLHGKEMPVLTSWNPNARLFEENEESELEQDLEDYQVESDTNEETDALRESVVPHNFSVDDLVFPYDLGLWGNIVSTFNYPWTWLFPWTTPLGNGYHFEKNEYTEDDQLGLPWPPDGGHQEFEPDAEVDLDNLTSIELRNIKQLRKRMDPRSNMDRKDWVNGLGETLGDFGVDLEAEDEENDDLLAKEDESR